MLRLRSILGISLQIAIAVIVPGGLLLVIAWRRTPQIRRFVASIRRPDPPRGPRTDLAP